MNCQACGVDKDIDVLETYPYPDDGICDEPIKPLMELDCDDRFVVVCHECFHKLDPDMWIDKRVWASINPLVSFFELPRIY